MLSQPTVLFHIRQWEDILKALRSSSICILWKVLHTFISQHILFLNWTGSQQHSISSIHSNHYTVKTNWLCDSLHSLLGATYVGQSYDKLAWSFTAENATFRELIQQSFVFTLCNYLSYDLWPAKGYTFNNYTRGSLWNKTKMPLLCSYIA